MPHRDGMELLSRALRQVALHQSPEELKKAYLPEDKDFKDCVRLVDRSTLGCWYCFVFTQNMAAFTLKADLHLKLEGMEVVWPLVTDNEEGQ